MKVFSFWRGLPVALLLLAATPAWAESPIGQVKTTSGSVMVTHQGTKVQVDQGTPIFLNDIISTGDDASVGITFVDNAMLSLGANSQFQVDSFAYDPAQNNASFIGSVSRGVMALISGDIVKRNPNNAVINTPVASIGIRGTRFVVRVEGEQ